MKVANSRGSLDPIDYIYARESSFESLLASNTVGGIAQYYTIYTASIYASVMVKSVDVQTDTLEANTITVDNLIANQINTKLIVVDTIHSQDISNQNTISTSILNASTSLTVANVKTFSQLSNDGLTVDGIISAIPLIGAVNNSNILINIEGIVDSTAGGNITLSTFNNESNGISQGNITLNTYGIGDIKLVPIVGLGQNPNDPEGNLINTLGNVFIGTLQFSMVDPTADPPNYDNQIAAINEDATDISIHLIPKGNGGIWLGSNTFIQDSIIKAPNDDHNLNLIPGKSVGEYFKRGINIGPPPKSPDIDPPINYPIGVYVHQNALCPVYSNFNELKDAGFDESNFPYNAVGFLTVDDKYGNPIYEDWVGFKPKKNSGMSVYTWPKPP
jgi:hypothetical protein